MVENLKAILMNHVSTNTYCRLVNLRSALRGKVHRITPASETNDRIHIAADSTDSIFICRRGRHNRYKRGVMAGVDRLAQDYSLDQISNLKDGLFIDCGANVGELGFWARGRGFHYIAFEPEPLEARCVDLNHHDGKPGCIRKALWKEETTLEFFNRAETADSSVLADTDVAPSITVAATTLDKAVDLSNVSGPVIFKLEAEGAEPEVLEGAIKSLSRIDWVAVDCGYERGPTREHTFVETSNFLRDHGFRLVAAKLKRVTALYQRIT